MFYKMFSAIIILVISSLSMMSQSVDEIIQKSIDASGGKDALSMKSSIIKMSMNAMGMDMAMTMYTKKPAFRLVQNVMGQEIIVIFDGEKGWMKSPMAGGVQDLSPEQIEQMKSNADVNSMSLYAYKEKGSTIEKVGKEKLDGVTVYNLKITEKDGTISNLYIDADKFIALKMVSNPPSGQAEIFFNDYKKMDCVLMPSKLVIKTGGMEVTMNVEDYKCNAKIEDSMFTKPE